MLSFSTSDLAPQDRFDQWREVRGKHLFGVTIELAPERRGAFWGAFSAHNVGAAVATEMQASAYQVSRTESDIARVSGKSLCLGLQIRGPGALDNGRNGVHYVRNGDMTVWHSDLPYAATPHSEADFHFRMLKIPLDDEITLGHEAESLFGAKPLSEPRFMVPFRALFDALTSPDGDIVDPVQDTTHAARLALALRGRLSLKRPEVRAALRAGMHYAALEIMARDMRRPNLTPAAVASELGISVRQIHILFERVDRSFARTLSTMRVHAARKLLVEVPTLSVTQIAYACGFDSLATFYRAFRGAYEMTPGDMRSS